jgi:hypothetical protein
MVHLFVRSCLHKTTIWTYFSSLKEILSDGEPAHILSASPTCSRITDTTYMSPKRAAQPPDAANNTQHKSLSWLGFLDSRQYFQPCVIKYVCGTGVSKPGFSGVSDKRLSDDRSTSQSKMANKFARVLFPPRFKKTGLPESRII